MFKQMKNHTICIPYKTQPVSTTVAIMHFCCLYKFSGIRARGLGRRTRKATCTNTHHALLDNFPLTGARHPYKEVEQQSQICSKVDDANVRIKMKLERCTGQVLPSAKYRPTCLVVDAAFRRIGKSRHGGHKIANSVNCQRI